MTTEDKSLSGLWRANASKDPGTDLASVLDAVRIIAQSLKPDTEVTFAGVKTAATDSKRIWLTAKYIGKEFPLSGDVVDRYMGLTVHELGHALFSDNKDSFTAGITIACGAYSQEDRSLVREIAWIFEDIYVDHLMTAYPGYYDYLRRARDADLAEVDLDLMAKPLTVECDRRDMLNALGIITLMGVAIPQGITDANLQILGELAGYANKMVTKIMTKETAVFNAYRLIHKLPAFIDHNTDGMMNQPEADEPQESESTQQNQSGESKESEAEPEQDGPRYEPEKPEEDKKPNKSSEDKPEDNPEDEPEENESGEPGEPDEPKGEKEDGEETDSESEADSGEGEEPDEMEDDEGGTGGGHGKNQGDEEPEDEPEADGDSEPEADEPDEPEVRPAPEPKKWKPVNLAELLDNAVDDDTKLDDKTAKEVSDAVVEKRADLSQLVSYLAKDSDSTILTYSPQEGGQNVDAARASSAEAEEKMRRILQDFRIKRTKDFRGLRDGRVSTRRLYRVAYGDQRVFQRRERPDEINMVVELLIDLSGSTHQMEDLIDQVVVSMTDAFTKEKVEFIALGYSGRDGRDGIVDIPRLYDKEIGKINLGLDSHNTWGSTPSYEGLAAAIAQLLRFGGNKQKVLFHFTDGMPNSGKTNQIAQLLSDAEEKGIIDIHICLVRDDSSGNQIANFKVLYGEDSLAITDIRELPDVVDQQLRQRLEI